MITIQIPTVDNIDYLNLFCRSIEQHTTVPYEICIWNNGNNSEIRDMCKAKGYTHFSSEENIGATAPHNIMVKTAKYDLIFIADNDYYVLPGWDVITQYDTDVYWKRPAMIDHREHMRVRSTIIAYYGNSIENFREHDLIRDFAGKSFNEIDAAWMPMVMKKQDFINIGGFLEGFAVAEIDFLWRAFNYYKEHNFKQRISGNSFIYHFGGKTPRTHDKIKEQEEQEKLIWKKYGLTSDMMHDLMNIICE